MGRPNDLVKVGEMRQTGCDVFGIEVQGPGEIAGGAPRVVTEEFDDDRVLVTVKAPRHRSPLARSPCGRSTY
jgi:hypothetical protein